MKPADTLAQFVRDGLSAGHSAQELRAALLQAGWREAEVTQALAGWQAGGLSIAVPRPRPHVSAREALLYGLLFFGLLSLCWNLVTLGFGLIEIWLGTERSYRLPRWSMAAMIVVTPLFVALYLHIERSHRARSGTEGTAIRHWFGAVTVLLAALSLLGAAVSVVYGLLSGDMTAQFAANTAWVVVVAGLVLAFFRDFLREG